jgi:hypothetical protein
MAAKRVYPSYRRGRKDKEGRCLVGNQFVVLINNGYLSGQGERLQMVGERIMLN